MLTALADEIVIPNYAQLTDVAQTFADASGPLGSYCSAISTAEESAAFAGCGNCMERSRCCGSEDGDARD